MSATSIQKREASSADTDYVEDDVCIICLQADPSACLLCCGIKSHIACMARWQSTQNQEQAGSCPNCRKSFADPLPKRRVMDDVSIDHQSAEPPSVQDRIRLLILNLRSAVGDLALCDAITALWTMSGTSANQIAMASQDLGLLGLLVELCQNSTGEVQIRTIGVLSNLSAEPSNHSLLASAAVGLVPVLVGILESSEGETLIKALRLLSNLSTSNANKIHFATGAMGLVDALVTLLREKTDDVKERVLSVLLRLSSVGEIQPTFRSSQLGLIPLTLQLATESTRVGTNSIRLLSNMTAFTENHSTLLKEYKLLEVMLSRLATTAGDVQLKVLRTLANLASSDFGRNALLDVEIIRSLVQVAGDDAATDRVRIQALIALTNLAAVSSDNECKIHKVSGTPPLESVLQSSACCIAKKILTKTDIDLSHWAQPDSIKAQCCNLLKAVSQHPHGMSAFIEAGLMQPLLIAAETTGSNDARSKILSVIATFLEVATAEEIIDMKYGPLSACPLLAQASVTELQRIVRGNRADADVGWSTPPQQARWLRVCLVLSTRCTENTKALFSCGMVDIIVTILTRINGDGAEPMSSIYGNAEDAVSLAELAITLLDQLVSVLSLPSQEIPLAQDATPCQLTACQLVAILKQPILDSQLDEASKSKLEAIVLSLVGSHGAFSQHLDTISNP